MEKTALAALRYLPTMSVAEPRARQLGLPLGGTPGPCNAITDVPGVEVGYETVIRLASRAGDVQVCSGVTAVLPRGRNPTPLPVWAGQFDFNGNGEMTGSHWVADAGYFIGPICLTNTHAVGAAHQAAVRFMVETYADHFHASGTARRHRSTGPPAAFQAANPPCRWQAEDNPASCAACTAMADRSPKAQ
jgi:Peptidase family S58